MLDVPERNPSESSFLLSTMPAGRSEAYLACGVVLALVVVLLATTPYARTPLDEWALLLPAYAAAVVVSELLTAVLLMALFSVQRSPAILVLASGYLCSGLLMVPWALTFPGVFAPTGLLGAGVQSTATIAAVSRIGFPLFVIFYALLNRSDQGMHLASVRSRGAILASATGVVMFVAAVTLLSVVLQDDLPTFMLDARRVSDTWRYVPAFALFLHLVAIICLVRGRRSVLDLWLIVVICTLIIEVLLLSYISAGRLSLGWWVGRFCGLASASIVLIVLLAETTTLYGRLIRSILSERRTREARLTGLETLAASIAHEVNQPLASMVTNAAAGLRWIEREGPDLKQTKAALKRIVDDGHRAGLVIEATRSMFRNGARERVRADLNGIILEVLRCARPELQNAHVSVRTELDQHLPSVTCSPMQMQQVLGNLIANAIDSMLGAPDGGRVLTVKSSISAGGDAQVAVEDLGSGLAPADKDRIFEPFYTTKPDGMGMGLMFCRSVIEAHGGRLWATDNHPQGAVFHFTLPANTDDPS
jgi:signal transduction histidine kinase